MTQYLLKSALLATGLILLVNGRQQCRHAIAAVHLADQSLGLVVINPSARDVERPRARSAIDLHVGRRIGKPVLRHTDDRNPATEFAKYVRTETIPAVGSERHVAIDDQCRRLSTERLEKAHDAWQLAFVEAAGQVGFDLVDAHQDRAHNFGRCPIREGDARGDGAIIAGVLDVDGQVQIRDRIRVQLRNFWSFNSQHVFGPLNATAYD